MNDPTIVALPDLERPPTLSTDKIQSEPRDSRTLMFPTGLKLKQALGMNIPIRQVIFEPDGSGC